VAELAAEFGAAPTYPCDVADDAQIDALFASLAKHWPDGFDGLLHAIAFAPREALKGEFHESVTREAFRIAHDVSSYSLAALAKGAAPLMQGRQGAIVTLTYLGAVRSIPRYNVRGSPRRASRRPCVPGLGAGSQGIRVNAIPAGPHQDAAPPASATSGRSSFRRRSRPAAPKYDRRGRQRRPVPALGSRERDHRRGDYVDAGYSTPLPASRTRPAAKNEPGT